MVYLLFFQIFLYPYQILKDSIYERYFADGTSERYEEIYIKVENEKGSREWTYISTSYTPYYNTSDFTKVEIIREDGEVVRVPHGDAKDVLSPPELGQFSGEQGKRFYSFRN